MELVYLLLGIFLCLALIAAGAYYMVRDLLREHFAARPPMKKQDEDEFDAV